MAVYHLIDNITGTQTAAPNLIQPALPLGVVPQSESFQVILNGIGSCAATVQLVATNDGSNMVNLGSVVVSAATADSIPGNVGTVIASSYAKYGAYVSSISGTDAAATCLMSA